jgi:hypothetical protein
MAPQKRPTNSASIVILVGVSVVTTVSTWELVRAEEKKADDQKSDVNIQLITPDHNPPEGALCFNLDDNGKQLLTVDGNRISDDEISRMLKPRNQKDVKVRHLTIVLRSGSISFSTLVKRLDGIRALAPPEVKVVIYISPDPIYPNKDDR